MDLENAKKKAELVEQAAGLTEEEKQLLLAFIKSLTSCGQPSGPE